MKKQLVIYFSLVLFTGIVQAGITPVNLTCENLHNPAVVDILKPRLSWINIAPEDERGQIQTAWEIRVASTQERLLTDKADLWNTGKVMSTESVNTPYAGKPLTSGQDCWWQVRVWDRKGKLSEWSEPAFWSMGLLNPEEWKAQWIGAPWEGEKPLPKPNSPRGNATSVSPFTTAADKLPSPAPMLRKNFEVDKEVASARAYVTGLGYFELYLNGAKVSEDVLTPNLTLYGKRANLGPIGVMIKDNFKEYRVMYLSYDIKNLLRAGENVIGAILGNGFYNPASYWTEGYGTPRFIGQIHIKYTDGTEQVILSDQSWKASKGPIIMDLIYDGEHYDARLEQQGWCAPGFDDSKWEKVVIRKAPEGIMKAHMSPTDRVMESLPPCKN